MNTVHKLRYYTIHTIQLATERQTANKKSVHTTQSWCDRLRCDGCSEKTRRVMEEKIVRRAFGAVSDNVNARGDVTSLTFAPKRTYLQPTNTSSRLQIFFFYKNSAFFFLSPILAVINLTCGTSYHRILYHNTPG